MRYIITSRFNTFFENLPHSSYSLLFVKHNHNNLKIIDRRKAKAELCAVVFLNQIAKMIIKYLTSIRPSLY